MSLASRIKAHLPHSKDSTSNDDSTTPTTISKELNEGSASESSKRGKEILFVFDNAFGHLVAGDA
ncbi:hypothetical protein LTR37_021493, partial [Vermiconidia calcicola]